MQGYVAEPDGAFARSRECFAELGKWLESEDAAGLQHGELEEQLDVRGRELLRRLFQDRLDLTAARAVRGMMWPGRTAFCARAPRRAVPGR